MFMDLSIMPFFTLGTVNANTLCLKQAYNYEVYMAVRFKLNAWSGCKKGHNKNYT